MWEYNTPVLEFTQKIPIYYNAVPWGGHSYFAYDLIINTQPKLVVELGTYKGNSLFSFAQAVKDLGLDTSLHAIDTWAGDEHSGYYDEDIFEIFNTVKNNYYRDLDITAHRMLFDEALNKFEDKSIDILHIDGLHTYEAVKHDLENWLPKVKDDGIVMFHDIIETRDDFGVYRLWEELEGDNTIAFPFYHGLGVKFLGEIPIEDKESCIEHYKGLADKLG